MFCGQSNEMGFCIVINTSEGLVGDVGLTFNDPKPKGLLSLYGLSIIWPISGSMAQLIKDSKKERGHGSIYRFNF